MKKLASKLSVLVLSLAAMSVVHAADDKHMMSISAAMEAKDAKEKLSGDVRFFFGNQKHPKIQTKLGSDFTNKKTNAFGKSAERACNWVFLSAMMAMQERARTLGANAVVNIVSYYKKDVQSSPTEFECHSGFTIAGVALKGDFVKISGK